MDIGIKVIMVWMNEMCMLGGVSRVLCEAVAGHV